MSNPQTTIPPKNGIGKQTSKKIADLENPAWGSRSVELFQKIDQIGAGTYGQVYKAKNRVNGEIVALKKVRMEKEKEGFPITAIREIKILKELNQPSIINLKEIVTSKASRANKGRGSIYMVFEYMDHDLNGLMQEHAKWFSEGQIKWYMKQLFEGLHYCHANNVLHRDLKGSNLLVNNRGELKLADFGLARPYNEKESANYTNRVITLWYRPPELLLGAIKYTSAIDIWSAGCILAELLAKKPIFPGRNEIDQLELIFNTLGTPNEDNWPGVEALPWYDIIKPRKKLPGHLEERFKSFPAGALQLVSSLLKLNPKDRISASQALDSDYFWTEPMPIDPKQIPSYPASHEFTVKKRKTQDRSSSEPRKQHKSQPTSNHHSHSQPLPHPPNQPKKPPYNGAQPQHQHQRQPQQPSQQHQQQHQRSHPPNQQHHRSQQQHPHQHQHQQQQHHQQQHQHQHQQQQHQPHAQNRQVHNGRNMGHQYNNNGRNNFPNNNNRPPPPNYARQQQQNQNRPGPINYQPQPPPPK